MSETTNQNNNSQNSRRHSVDASIYSGNHQISNRNQANHTGQPNPSDILSQQIQGNMNVTQASAAALFLAAQQQAQASQSMGMMGGNINGQQTAAANAAAAAAALLFPQQQQQQQQQFQQQTSENQQKNQNNLSLSNELKFLQQLQMEVGAQNSNALLLPSSSRSNDGGAAAFLQSVLDQKVRNPRFDNPLAQAMMGFGGMNSGLLQNNYLNDARLLMAQHSQLNPQLIMQNHMSNTQCNSFPQQSLQNSDMPLPSPHALFHRDGSKRMRGGVIEPFPEKLHRLLTEVESAGRSDVISFVASGRAFAIHKPDNFFKEIVPLYFRQSRLSSFKRQLNLYGFELINTGPARGGYYHELFVKDQPELCRRMRRVAVKVSSSTNKNDEDGELEKEIDPTRESKEKETNSVE